MRIGTGYDSHRLVDGRRLIIGGVDVPYEKGLLGHSDGDVLCHAVIDALIGALGAGDIGQHFPDTQEQWKDASSIRLLRHILELVHSSSYEVAWIDAVVLAERPKLAPFIDSMKAVFAGAGIPSSNIILRQRPMKEWGLSAGGRGLRPRRCVC